MSADERTDYEPRHRTHHFRRRFQILRRDFRRQSRKFTDWRRDNESGRAEWFGQDHADEPDDGFDKALAGEHQRAWRLDQ